MAKQREYSDEERRLLGSIYECPKDVMRFLVYADWLEENGDPLSEFIRVQCAMECMAENHPDHAALQKRERAAKKGRLDDWRGYGRGRNFDAGFRRGLPVIGWHCPDRRFFEIERFLLSHATPRHGVHLDITVEDESLLPKIFASPLFQQLRQLALLGPMVRGPDGNGGEFGEFGKEALHLIAEQGFAERLEGFFAGNPLDDFHASPAGDVNPDQGVTP